MRKEIVDMPEFRPGRTERFADQPAEDSLPAFGRLCSRFARFLGASPLALASPRQRRWIAEGRASLDLMADAGSPLDTSDVELVVMDARAIFARFDWRFSNGRERFATPSGSSGRSVTSLHRESGEPFAPRRRSTISIGLTTQSAMQDWDELSKAFGSDPWATAFLVGHEAGHAIQARQAWPMLQATMRAVGGSLGAEGAAYAGNPWIRTKRAADQSHVASLCMLFEESICDAIGVWAAGLAGCPDPAGACALYRQGAALVYDTTALVAKLPDNVSNMDFEAFSKELGALSQAVAPEMACRHRLAHRLAQAPEMARQHRLAQGEARIAPRAPKP